MKSKYQEGWIKLPNSDLPPPYQDVFICFIDPISEDYEIGLGYRDASNQWFHCGYMISKVDVYYWMSNPPKLPIDVRNTKWLKNLKKDTSL